MRTPDCMFEKVSDFICAKGGTNHWIMLGAKDSPNRALIFLDDIIAKINKIPESPYSYRQRLVDDK